MCKSRKTISNLFIVIALVISFSNAYCAGEIRHYQIQTTILGKSTQRGLSVYLPEGYENSGRSYPALYLIHGDGGDDTGFLGSDSEGTPDANVSVIIERLVREGRGKPLIAVCPNVNGIGSKLEYLLQKIIPFVDSTFRTIPNRDSRAIAGHSTGGYEAISIALSRPELYCVAGGFSSYGVDFLIPKLGRLLGSFDQEMYPIHFWLYAGRQDQWAVTQPNRDFARALQGKGLPTEYAEDDGDHFSKIGKRLSEFVEYLSEHLQW